MAKSKEMEVISMSIRRIYAVKLFGKEIRFKGPNIVAWPFVSLKETKRYKMQWKQ